MIANNVLCSHLQAAPSTNIYFRTLYSCVRREAAPPFSSLLWSFLPGLVPYVLSSPLAVTMLSAWFFSWGKLFSWGRWPGSLSLHSPASPHVAVARHPGERHLSPSPPLPANSRRSSLIPFFGSFAFQAGWKSAKSIHLDISKRNIF